MFMSWQRGWNGINNENDAPDYEIVHRPEIMRALAWARVPAWACRLGAGRPVGPGVRGACLWDGQLLGGLDFLEVVAIRYY